MISKYLVCAISIPVSLLAVTTVRASDDAPLLSLETTVVNHRTEPVQWTSESITVLTRKELESTYRYELEDLEGMAPGLVIDSLSETPRGAAMSLRGMASREGSKGFFPAVAVKVDGVYVGTHTGQNQVLFDFDRAEIARGPQGALQGEPALGGTVNLYRNKPSGRLSSRSRVVLGDFKRRRFDTVVHFPIMEGLAGKATLNWWRGGAGGNLSSRLIANNFDGREENEERYTAGSLSALWQNDAGWEVQYTYDIVRDDSDVPALLNLSSLSDLLCSSSVDEANCSIDGEGLKPETDSIERTTQNFSNLRAYDVDQHAVHIAFSFLEHDFESITAFRQTDEVNNQDRDATFIDFYSTTDSQDYDQFSQELILKGDYNDKLTYSAGLYYFSNEYSLDRTDFFILDRIDEAGSIIPVPTDATRMIHSLQRATLRSFFAHGRYQFGDQWWSNLGLRWNHAKRTFMHTVSRPGTTSPSILIGEADASEPTATIGVTFKVDEEAMMYLKYSNGFRPPGFDDNANSADSASPYSEEKVDSLEFGIKSEWYDDRLRLNYVHFQNDYKSKLERFTSAVSSGRVESVLGNVARMESTGHEVDLEAIPFENLTIRAALLHQNADYVQYRIPDLANPGEILDLESLVPTLAPSNMFYVSGEYSFPYKSGRVNLFGSYRFTSEYWSHSQVPAGRIDNFTILDFSIEYAVGDWKFRMFSRNANDKRYLINAMNPRDTEFASLHPGVQSVLPLNTATGFNQPEFSGFEIIYNPTFGD